MRAFTSRAKRILALLLAVLLMVPTMAVHIHAEEPGSAELMLSELIVANYDELSAAEKAILSSGVLKNDLKLDTFPSLEGHSEIELNAEEKTISATSHSEAGYTWTPVSATIYADGVEKEKITLTNGKGSYTYDGNAFYVDVTYSLTKAVADDDQAGHLALLNVAYNLYQDVTYLQQVTSKKDSLTLNGVKYSAVQLLNVLTDANIGSAMGLTGTIIDQINALSIGIDEVFTLPDGSDGEIYIQLSEEAVEAAAALKAQQDENGGLALARFFAKYGSLSMLEIVAEHEAELQAALLDSYTNLKALADALPDLVDQVDGAVYDFERPTRGYLAKIYSYVYDVLSEVKDAYPQAGLDTYLADGKITADEIKSLSATLDAEYKGVINEINAALEGTGYSVTSAADIEGIIADMNGKLDNIVDEVNAALAGTGYSIESVADLAGLITTFEGELASALASINTELAKLTEIDPELDFEVSSAAELAQVISILEAYLAEKETELESALAELNKVLSEETGYEKEVTSVADAQEAVVWMEDQVATYVAELNGLLEEYGYTIETSADIDTIVTDISEQLASGKADLDAALAELNELLEGTDYTVETSADIDTVVAGIEAEMAAALDEVETTVNSNAVVQQFGLSFTFETKADVEAAIAELTPYASNPVLGGAISEVIATLEAVVAELERGEEAVAALKDAKDGLAQAEEAIATAEDLISELNTAKADFVEAENTIAEFKAGVEAMVEGEAALADAEAAIAGLKTAKDTLADAETALNGLKEAQTLLEKAEDGIATMETAKDALAELETVKTNLNAVVELEAMVAELKQMGEALSTLATAFGMLVADGVLDEAVATRDWAAADHIDTAAAVSADYQALTDAVIRAAKTKAYTEADVAAEMHIMDGTQRANLSMHDVTVNVVLQVVNANNDLVDYKITTVLTLPNLTSGTTLEKQIGDLEKDALSKWSGIYVAGKYNADASTKLPAELTGDLEYTITYSPVDVEINYLGTEKSVPYGTTLTLEPYTDNAAWVYDYYVDGVKYLQGAKIVVKDELTVTRELGKAYKIASLYNVLTAQLGETTVLVDVLNSNGTTVGNQFYSVRYPENSDNLITTEVTTDTKVTAQNFDSGYKGLVWVPSVVKVYGGSVDEVAFNGSEAVVEGVYEHLEVEYKLVLGLDANEILSVLNGLVSIHDDAVDQLADMQTLVNQMSQLGLVTAAMEMFEEKAALQATKDAIAYVNGPECVNDSTGNLYLVDHVNAYADTANRVDHGLYYYYLNSADIIYRLNDLIPQIRIVIEDPNFPEFLEGYREFLGDMDINDIVEGIEELAASLAAHPANKLISDAQAVAKALGNGTIPCEPADLDTKLGDYVTLPEGDPALLTTLVQAPVGQVAVNVTITLKDETGVGAANTITKFFLENSTLTADDVAAIVAEAAKYGPEDWELDWHSVVSDTGSTVYDLEARLNTYKTVALTSDVNISYTWSFDCDHANTSEATCVEGSYCLTCGTEVSGPDLVNGHSLSTAVTTAPSCEKDGIETTTCSLCGMVTTEPIAKLGHNWGAYTSDNNATCTEDGTETRYCQRSSCGAHETRTEEGSATGHSYADSWTTVGADGHIRYCEVCHEAEDHVHEHVWDEGEVTLAATCTKEGEMTYECTANGCTETKTEAIEALGHDFSGEFFYTEDGHGHVCANCGEEGGAITAHTYATTDCTVRAACTDGCGYIKAAGEHVWAWATAGEMYGIGSHKRTCENCGKTETADHVWDEGVVTTEPGCENTGVLTHTCTLCAEDWLETLPAGSHQWGKWYADGDEQHSRACSECGEVESEAHNVNNRVVTVEPTCEVHGEATYYCDVCDHAVYSTTEEEDLAPLGHDMGQFVSNNDATCTSDGTKTAECKRCDYTETVADEGTKLGHDYSGELVNYGAEGHAHKCVNCGEVNPVKSAHVFEYEGEANCAEEATCACGEIKPAGQHDYEPKNDHGDTQHSLVCKTCGDTIYADHSWNSFVVTEPGCETPGVEGHTCICGHYYETEIDPAGHVWGEYVLDGESSCTEGGTETSTCEVCGATDTRDVEAAGHTWDSYENLGAAGHIPVCSVCGEEGELTAHEWTKDEENSTPSTLVSVCACGETKSELVGSSEVEGNRGVVSVTLYGNANDPQYAVEYTIDLGEYGGEEITITVTLNSDMEYSISDLAQEVATKYGYTYGDIQQFVWNQYQNGSVSVSWQLIDKYAATLVTFVQTLNADGVKGNLDFSLVETDDGFVIVANVTNAAGAMSAIQNLVMALASGGYNYIGFENHEGVDQMFYDITGPAVSIQGLIDGILARDGFGTDTLLEVVNANGTINPATVPAFEAEDVLVGGKIGGVLQIAKMNLGTSSTNIQQSVDFYLTLTDAAMLGQVIPALNAASSVVRIYTLDGTLRADLELPEKVYEAYLAAALVTGDVNKDDMEAVKAEAAFNYLYSYIKAVTGPGVTYETLENTAAKVGASVDLSAYGSIINTVIAQLQSVNEITAENRELKAVALSAPGKSLIDGLLAAAGMNLGPMASMLEMIEEYKAGGTLNLALSANLVEGEKDFQVAVIDINNASTLDKADLAEDGVARINSLAGTAAVMLLDDIKGDLVFKHTTILDLNGKTIDGSITANGTLIIIDSAMNTVNAGWVTGSVSGNVTIVGGGYADDVSELLSGSYVQRVDGCVTNALYAIEKDAEGNLNVYLTPGVFTDPTSYFSGVRDMAIDLAADLALNYFTSAAFAFDGNDIYAVNLPDILGMISGENKAEKIIDTLLACVNFDGGIDEFINAIMADLLDFEALATATAPATRGALAQHQLSTRAWAINLKHIADGDYLTLGIENENEVHNFNLSLFVEGDNAVYTWLNTLFAELANILHAEAEVQFNSEPEYNNGSLTLDGSAHAALALDLTGDPNYLTVIGVIMIYGNESIKQDVVNALNTGDVAKLQKLFNNMTIGQMLEGLKALHEDVKFDAAAKNFGVTDYAGAGDSSDDIFHLILTALGELYGSFYNAIDPKVDLDGILGKKLGGALQADGTYAVGPFTRDTSGSVSLGGFTVNYAASADEFSITADIFPDVAPQPPVKEYFTVTFDGNGGVGSMDELTVEAGTTIVLPENGFIAPYGKLFEDWDIAGVAYQPGESYEVNADTVVTATWKNKPVVPEDDDDDDYTETGCCHWYHCPSSWYADLDVNAWYHTATDYAICRGLMIGVQLEPEHLFAPDMATSRAMIVTTLYRLEGSPEVEYTAHYTDVADGLWYSDAIVWATNNGIVEGYGDGLYGPNDYVTREQICTIFFRYANFKGLDTSDRADISDYVDADQVSDWALEAVQWDVAVGMIKGTSTNEKVLDPKIDTSRAMMAMLLLRWCEKVN